MAHLQGCVLTELAPGCQAWPKHWHGNNEEVSDHLDTAWQHLQMQTALLALKLLAFAKQLDIQSIWALILPCHATQAIFILSGEVRITQNQATFDLPHAHQICSLKLRLRATILIKPTAQRARMCCQAW